MYNKYFNITKLPFVNNLDTSFLYMSEQHCEAIAHLLYGLNSGAGIILFTGKSGTGKTLLSINLLKKISNNYKIALIQNTNLSSIDLLSSICNSFELNSSDGKSANKYFETISRYLRQSTYENKCKHLLIIDEAQNLNAGALEYIRLLSNNENEKEKLIQIILIGQPEILKTIYKYKLGNLYQRIGNYFNLSPLSSKDVVSYVNHRLSIVGIDKRIFPTSILIKLSKISGGIPRIINNICDRALLLVYAEGRQTVSNKILKKVAREILFMDSFNKPHSKFIKLSTVILSIALISTIVYYSNIISP